jgi:hypothetical protein
MSSKDPVKAPKHDDPVCKEQAESGQQRLHFYKEKVSQFIPPDFKITELADLADYEFELSADVHDAYIEEVENIIQFTMIIVQTVSLEQAAHKKLFFNFLKAKADVLQAVNICIHVPSNGTIDQRWKLVEDQIELLDPQQLKIFNQIKKLWVKENKNKKEEAQAVKDQERQKAMERDEQTAEKRRQKEEQLAKLQEEMERRAQELQDQGGRPAEDDENEDLNIEGMPDCLPKYHKIVKRAKKGMGKFEDNDFKASNRSLGEAVQGRQPNITWHRMSEENFHQGSYEIFMDGVSVNDVEQGELGDCYYLSALSCLDGKRTRERFVFLSSEEEWKECGAICIRFFDGGKEDIVIIDDYLPLSAEEFVFVHCQNRREIWAPLLEKAYAKKYGDYSIIEGGFVDLALSDLTNGIPETIEINEETNQQKVWDQIMALYGEGSVLLGAGSPSHPDGDRAKSDTGIVQGHAYSVIKLCKVNQYKLICLRNPWGHGEWTGDWSDNSELWTPRIKNQTGQTDDFAEDGIFWMEFNDFCDEFDEIYICRDYNAQTGWKSILLEDEWMGDYAQGIPNKNNREAKFDKNPQFGIKVEQPGKGFVVMRMKEKKNAYIADQTAYLLMQQNANGQLIKGPKKSLQVCSIGPRNHPLQSSEVEFPASLSYPYVFSACVANMNHGAAGEGHFSLQFFQKAHQIEAKKLN